jgi:hypothetical protein
LRNSSGNFAIFAAIRRASSRVIVGRGSGCRAGPTNPKTKVAKFRAAFLFAVRGGVTPQVAAKTTRCCKAQRKLRSALGSTLSLARF